MRIDDTMLYLTDNGAALAALPGLLARARDGERVRNDALEEAALIADQHWPETGHVHPEGAISCQMSISVFIRRLKSESAAAARSTGSVDNG